MNNPKVSVCCTTYNQENFIGDAIEGFLAQRTSFPIEIIIHDDASTDNTPEIVRRYAEKYPDIIIPILQSENQWSKGVRPSPNFVWPKTRGEYLALCEGDDYWIDPLKLQKQVDFLESNTDYSICFHNSLILWENKQKSPAYFCPKDQKETSGIEDVFHKWFIPSASMLFKKDSIFPLPDWFKEIYNADWALHMLLADKGKIGYLDRVMAVYRKNEGSLSGGIGKNTEYINGRKIRLLELFNEHSENDHQILINSTIERLKKQIKDYNLRSKKKYLYYLVNPKKIGHFLLRKLGLNK